MPQIPWDKKTFFSLYILAFRLKLLPPIVTNFSDLINKGNLPCNVVSISVLKIIIICEKINIFLISVTNTRLK